MEIEYWVLHSPYPDKSWRGVEKCAIHQDGPILFDSEESARNFIDANNCDPYFVPVRVMLVVPDVRGSLDNLNKF